MTAHRKEHSVHHPKHASEHQRTFRRSAIALFTAEFLLGIGSAGGAVLPGECTALGGSIGEDGVCSFSATQIPALSDDWEITTGQAVVITGGTSYAQNGITTGAANETNVRINIADGASLSVIGGTAGTAHGIGTATDGGSLAVNVAGGASFSIAGGTAGYGEGIDVGAKNGGVFAVRLNEGAAMSIKGSRGGGNGMQNGAEAGGRFLIDVGDAASLTIESADTLGIYAAAGAGGTAEFRNSGTGSITIGGAETDTGAAVVHGADGQGASFAIVNGGSGTISIAAGRDVSSYGILNGARTGGTFLLRNEGEGTISISGSTVENPEETTNSGSIGLGVAAVNAAALIENAGPGTIVFCGGNLAGSVGMNQGVTEGGQTDLVNSGSGSILIKGGDAQMSRGIGSGAGEGTFRLINSEDGRIDVLGGSAYNSSGMTYLARTADAIGLADNRGVMIIGGGSGEGTAGLGSAADSGAKAAFFNRTGAQMILTGSGNRQTLGVRTFANGTGSAATLTNESGAVLNIVGGEGSCAAGIFWGAYGTDATFLLDNQEGALLTMKGGAAAAVFKLNGSTGSSASIVNSGTAVMNANAFTMFGEANADGTKAFTNKASGKLRAESGTLFTGTTVTKTAQTKTLTINILGEDGTLSSEDFEVSGYDYSISGSAIAMKDDWVNLAEFEEGSTVVFTDVQEGTAGAETILSKFVEVHGTGVNVVFTKPFAERGLDAASARTLAEARPGAIFYDTDVDAAGDVFKITQSTGFRSITGAANVTVSDGANLTLTGTGSVIADSPVIVKAGAALTLEHTDGTAADQGGSIRSLISAGTLSLRGGDYTVGSLKNTGTAISDAGTVLTVAAQGPSELGLYVNRGVVRIAGSVTGGTLTQERGHLEVASGAAAHFESLSGSGTIDNRGTLVADSGVVTGSVTTNGITVLENYQGGITSTFSASEGSTVMADSFNALGVVRTGNASLVIGAGSQKRYLLEHLEVARTIVEAGGTVDPSVMEALDAASGEPARVYIMRRALMSEDAAVEVAETLPDEDAETPTIPVSMPQEIAQEASDTAHPPIRVRSLVSGDTLAGALFFAVYDRAVDDAAAAEEISLAARQGLSAELLSVRTRRGAYKDDRSGVRVGWLGADEHFSFGITGTFSDGKLKYDGSRTSRFASGTVFGALRSRSAVLTGYAGYGYGRTDDAEDHVSSDTFSAGLEAAFPVQAGDFEFTSHVGIRGLRIEADAAETAATGEVPIGLRFRGHLSAGDKVFMPLIDITHIRTFGDRDVRVETPDAIIDSAFTGRHRTEMRLGTSAWFTKWRAEAAYRGAVGDDGFRSHSVMMKGHYQF